MMVVGVAFASAAVVIGLYLSYYLNVASGAAIVLVSTCLFFLTLGSRHLLRAAEARA
jgi:ABC-type Mn2+/Zn2+ transport system permease subunit